MTPREVHALFSVYDLTRREASLRWAIERVHFCNAHFNQDGAGWVIEDFLGGGNREDRIREAEQQRVQEKAQELMNKRAAIHESIAVDAAARAGKVPEWALAAKAAHDERLRRSGQWQ